MSSEKSGENEGLSAEDGVASESLGALVPSGLAASIPGAVSEAETGRLFTPPIDIYETADGLVLYADLPGVTADSLDLQVQEKRLTLYGRVQRSEVSGERMLHQEYQTGDFLRSFILSDEVDHERIQAKLNNGVLRVELPRAARVKPRRIDVSSG